MEIKIPCNYLNCKHQIDLDSSVGVFSILLDENGHKTDGSYCSLKCALSANKEMMSLRRMTGNWQDRDKWTREFYLEKHKNGNSLGKQ